MLSFAIGHMYYILAFGFVPLNISLGVALYAVNCIGLAYLMPGLQGILIPGVTVYTCILSTMLWRAIARVQFDVSIASLGFRAGRCVLSNMAAE